MRYCTLHLALIATLCAGTAVAQENGKGTEVRLQKPGNDPDGTPRIAFLSHRLGSDHAEGISALDINGDGFNDLLSGAYWYENPGAHGGDWKQHQFRAVGTHEEFVSDCGEWIVDVDHDGLPDLVTAGWIANGLWWYKNPGASAAPGTLWQREKITDSYDTEGGAFADINGDGKPDVALAHYDKGGILWVDFSGPRPKVHHVDKDQHDGHGIGVADVDGDGKADLLTPYGWYKNIDANSDQWEWHGDWRLGDAGFPILGYDVNHDGKMDLIYGQGHGYGLFWLEQSGSGAGRRWTQHLIDESFSQSHALRLADIDGDGQPELITGKRYRGHSGNDAGSYDPVVLYAYRIGKTGTFTRFTLSYNGTASAGTQILAEDFDHDGDLDIATAGKLGVHFLENLKVADNVPKTTREAQQPIERKWPFPGEGQEVPQEENPSKKQ
ncbi:VCBS repeat-containing protein [Granulicella sp. WH15]|uniref:FG-GAP repeat domain-containing protein n=1 Tax=Granulicella sp. WH15 TaxID=2602070 RepID=UPI0013677A45|nr:VCBS repeat-containing protein [Granulicella sp. WH15]QHN04295.1 VCBS repeat-containing protein [Granulicella sp. WH15]